MAHGTKILKKQKRRHTQETGQLRERIRGLETDLFCLWEYICSENLANEAREYLEENADNGIPFDFE